MIKYNNFYEYEQRKQKPKKYFIILSPKWQSFNTIFIELLSEIPTYGCCYRDIEINKNKFDEHIPFNIPEHFDKKDCYFKYHDAKRFRKKIM